MNSHCLAGLITPGPLPWADLFDVMNGPYSVPCFWTFVVAVLILVFGMLAYGSVYDARRLKQLKRIAADLGLTLHEEQSDTIPAHPAFKDGTGRAIFNVLRGRVQNHAVEMGDYTYTTGRGKDATQYTYSFVYIGLGHAKYPDLCITPNNAIYRMLNVALDNQIGFESAQFTELFHVQCPERKFAFQLVTPATMEWLMAHPNLTFHLGAHGLVVQAGWNRMPADGFRPALEAGFALLKRIPDFVREDHKAG